jgi:hypothetical protein
VADFIGEVQNLSEKEIINKASYKNSGGTIL